MNFKEIQEFVQEIAKTGVTEVKIETKDLKIIVKNSVEDKVLPGMVSSAVNQMQTANFTPVAQPVNPDSKITTASDNQTEENTSKCIQVKAPMVGTFYRKPAPDKETFVKVGDQITAGQVICIIEAMKLFNEIEAEVSGKIVKIMADDSVPVEFDQPLFLVEPM